ncbi:hypothetical protein H4R20_003078, partial [Coemansia guatemalensis]
TCGSLGFGQRVHSSTRRLWRLRSALEQHGPRAPATPTLFSMVAARQLLQMCLLPAASQRVRRLSQTRQQRQRSRRSPVNARLRACTAKIQSGLSTLTSKPSQNTVRLTC